MANRTKVQKGQGMRNHPMAFVTLGQRRHVIKDPPEAPCSTHLYFYLLYGALQVVAFKSSLISGPKCKMRTKVSVIVCFLPGQGCKNSWPKITHATKVCMVAINIHGSSVWHLFLVTLLAPVILSWLLDFGKYVHLC